MSNNELLTKEKEQEIITSFKKVISSFNALSEETRQEMLNDIPSFLAKFDLTLNDENKFSLIDMDLSNVKL